MSALKDMLQQYRTKLTQSPASLTSLPENIDTDDIPASNLHQTFVLVVGTPPGPPVEIHGGGKYQYTTLVEVRVFWRIEMDLETLHDTIADDLVNIDQVMLTASNRPSNTLLVQKTSGGTLDEFEDFIMAAVPYAVQLRETVDLT